MTSMMIEILVLAGIERGSLFPIGDISQLKKATHRQLFFSLIHPTMSIHQLMQSHGPDRQHMQMAFDRFSERIEQAPAITIFKVSMPWSPPSLQYPGNPTRRTDTVIHSMNNQIMGNGITYARVPVRFNPAVLVCPLRDQMADGLADQFRKVPGNEVGVLPAELDLATERQIITDKNSSTSNHASSEAFVVTVI